MKSVNFLHIFVLSAMTMACTGQSEVPTFRGTDVHPPDRYTQVDSTAWLLPLRFEVDPMEALVLINFEDDPDEHYIGLEPQYFNDAKHGKGLLVIAWRSDMQVEVYHQPQLRLDSATYSIAGKGLAHMEAQPFEGAYLRIDEQGVQCSFAFTDRHGRQVEASVHEGSSKLREPFGLLAPMGDAAEAPMAMPLVLLHDFYFVRRSGSEVMVRIDDRLHQPDKLPLPMDWQRMYFIRYSPDPLIALFNPAHDGILAPFRASFADSIVQHLGHELYLDWHQGVPELREMRYAADGHSLSLAFNPPFPQPGLLREGIAVEGEWILQGHPSTGYIPGTYHIAHTDGQIRISLQPESWQPVLSKTSLRLMYGAIEMFKGWPCSYRWEASIKNDGEYGWHMHSYWLRSRPDE